MALLTESHQKLLKLKKEELKDEARKKSLPVNGNKIDLVNRLLSYAEREGHSRNHLDMVVTVKQNGTNGNSNGPPKRRVRTQSQAQRQQQKEEREGIVLWKRPITTIHYSAVELVYTIKEWCQKLMERKRLLLCLILLVAASVFLLKIDGPFKKFFQDTETYLLWCAWWVGLGVLSSVGFGTGLHTFLLYLGPHIAAVTLAAYECGSTDFPSPPYPDSILCPDSVDDETKAKAVITMWDILAKVRIEAFCWGAGTALGELPPYFVARAHRLSGYDPDDEEDEFEELQEKLAHPENLNWFDRAKLGIERLVEKVGFVGILACASIPNPLFDLAGITCGHFLVPFWTFFGATLIGKAVIKMHIQKLFVITAFNENLIASAVSQVHRVPWIGPKLEAPFKELLAKQKEKLHRKVGTEAVSDPSLLSWIFEKFVLAMIIFFVLSIINSLAQSYHKRIQKKRRKSSSKEH